MKVCPLCGDTYRDHVDFCFVDGAVLDGAPSAESEGESTPAPEAAAAFAPVVRAAPDVTDAPAPPALDPPILPVPTGNGPQEEEERPEEEEEVDPAPASDAPPAESDPANVVRTRTPEMPAQAQPTGPVNPPVIQRIEVVRTPTEFARSGEGPTPLEVPRHVVRIEPVPAYEYESEADRVLTSPLLLTGAGLLFVVVGLAFSLVLWAFGEGREDAIEEPTTVSGAPGPFVTDPPGAYVFVLGGAVNGEQVSGPRYIGKTTWNGVRFPLAPAEYYVFRVVLDGFCPEDLMWDGGNDGAALKVELSLPPCADGAAAEHVPVPSEFIDAGPASPVDPDGAPTE